MLHEFRNFSKDRLDLDQLVALAAFGRQLRAEYEAHQLEEPAWLDSQIKALRHEIRARSQDQLEARRKEINSRLDSLKTPGEKKTELLKEKTKIEKQLAEIGA